MLYAELKDNLSMHMGTEKYYKVSPFVPTVITDGVKYFCDKCECYWLIEHMLFNGLCNINKEYGFLVITVNVNKRGTCHVVAKEDTGEDMPVLYSKKVKDLCKLIPSGEYKFYLIDQVMLLPSEY